jgi:hypothetical protein
MKYVLRYVREKRNYMEWKIHQQHCNFDLTVILLFQSTVPTMQIYHRYPLSICSLQDECLIMGVTRVRKTGGNRSGPVHEPVRFPPQNRAYKFVRTVNRPVSPVNHPVFFIRGNRSAAVLLTLGVTPTLGTQPCRHYTEKEAAVAISAERMAAAETDLLLF